MAAISYDAINVHGLSDAENDTANRLLAKLQAKYRRNLLRKEVYESKDALGRIMQVLPMQYNSLGIALGWCAKSVDLLARRCKLNGFKWAGGDLNDLGLSEIWNQNMLGSEVGQSIDSALIHSTAFIVTTEGLEGEPDVVWQTFDATDATGDWDARARRLTSLITLTGRSKDGKLSSFTLYLHNVSIYCENDGGWKVVARREHDFGIPADPLPYGPRLNRPFGRSRISRPMIGLQRQAVRSLLRLEGHLDVYAFPEFWMLGADPSIFTGSQGLVQSSWETMIGRIKGLPDDPQQSDPKLARADVKKFDAASPEPHLAALNAFAKLFAREASLPDSSLAITDISNPTSAESYDASQYDLIAESEGTIDGFSPFLERSMARALSMANGEREIRPEFLGIKSDWRNPRFVSRAAEADAGMKQIAAIPWLAETETGLELLGLDSTQVEMALAERQRIQGRDVLTQLASFDGGGQSHDDEQLKRMQTLRTQFDALGIARRAGVDADSAAEHVGLTGLKFMPGAPITIRQDGE